MAKTQEKDHKGKASLEHMVLSNSLTLMALTELLDEQGVVKLDDLLERMRKIQKKAKLH